MPRRVEGMGEGAPPAGGLDRGGPDQLPNSINSFQRSVCSSALTQGRKPWALLKGIDSQRRCRNKDGTLTLSVVAVGEGRGDQRALREQQHQNQPQRSESNHKHSDNQNSF